MKKLIGLKKIKTAVFISGTGSNLKNLIKFSKTKISPILIKLIISNNKKAKGLKYSTQYNIEKKIVNFNNNFAENKILNYINKKNIKFICLAGFMIVLSKNFIKKFKGIKKIDLYPESLDFDNEKLASFFSQFIFGFNLKSYTFNKYKTLNKEKINKKIDLKIITSSKEKIEKKYKYYHAIKEGVFLSRDLVSEPPNILNPF